MISKFFNKSKPINYIVTTTLFVGLFIWHFIQKQPITDLAVIPTLVYIERFLFLLVILLSLFIGHFIIKNNKLDKNNSYAFLINSLLLLCFPAIFYAHTLVISNLFLLLAAWNLVSSDSFFVSKERIFNASLCVFIATIFNFWAILFIGVVFLSIFLNLQQDFRRLFVPFIAFFAIAMLYLAIGFFQDDNLLTSIQLKMDYNIDWFYLQSPIQIFLFGFFLILATLTFLSFLFSITDMSKKITESYVKIAGFFIISVLVGALSVEKTTDLFVYAIFPVSVLSTKFVENLPKKWARNLFLSLLIIVAAASYSSYYWEEYQYWEIDYDYIDSASKYFISPIN